MKKYIALLAALAALATNAQASFGLGSDGPLGFSYWHDDHWDHNGVHIDPPQSVPEPASPVVMLALAGAALILRRNGGAK